MSNDQAYHQDILKKYLDLDKKQVSTFSTYIGADGNMLAATEIDRGSRRGIIIIPGLTVPRESYYKLMADISHYNLMIFDLPGQGGSTGFPLPKSTIQDINKIGRDYKNENDLEYLVGVGHSYGGTELLLSSMEDDHPYDLRIGLAPPNDMRKTASKLPNNYLLAVISSYIFSNIVRPIKSQAFRSHIVKHHQCTNPIRYLTDPRIVALDISDPQKFNRITEDTPILADNIDRFKLPSYIFYAENDSRLGLDKGMPDDYEDLTQRARRLGFRLSIIPGLSHRFNAGIETEFVVSYDNDQISKKIMEAILESSLFMK